MTLSEPQRALLSRVEAEGRVTVRGNALRTARALAKKGLVEYRVHGVAWEDDWYIYIERKA